MSSLTAFTLKEEYKSLESLGDKLSEIRVYSHITKELMIIELKFKKNSNTLVDYIDMVDGEAFNKFLGCRNLVRYINRDFGDAIIR